MGGELSIVIPAYNEEERIRGTLERIGEYLAGRDYEAEVIVVSDGSRDRTADIVREMKTAINSASEYCIPVLPIVILRFQEAGSAASNRPSPNTPDERMVRIHICLNIPETVFGPHS